jgi:hypothetical protein
MPGGISSDVTRSMRRFFLLPVDMTLARKQGA